MKLLSSILHITNHFLNFRRQMVYQSHPLAPLETRPCPLFATSVLMKILRSLQPISDPLVTTSGTLSILHCRTVYLRLHILAYQCNPRAPCRTRVWAAAGPILLLILILLRIVSLRRRDKTTPICRLDRAPSHLIIFIVQTMISAASGPIELLMASKSERGRK